MASGRVVAWNTRGAVKHDVVVEDPMTFARTVKRAHGAWLVTIVRGLEMEFLGRNGQVVDVDSVREGWTP